MKKETTHFLRVPTHSGLCPNALSDPGPPGPPGKDLSNAQPLGQTGFPVLSPELHLVLPTAMLRESLSATRQRGLALPSPTPHAALAALPSPCPSATLSLPSPLPFLALDLPLVFFSFLQTRQATKVLNPTSVPRASPPATTMPSSGTSTRVARSPASCPLVRF